MWHMTFNDGDEPDGPPPHSPPDNELPVTVPITGAAVRAGDLAIALTHALVFSTGWELHAVGRLRPSAGHTFFESPGRREGLLLGVRYVDGREGASILPPWSAEPTTPGDVTVQEYGGGGSAHEREYSWWLTPLPPRGPVTLVLGGPDLDPGEHSFDIEGAALADASDRVVTLWPWEPPRHEEPEPPSGDQFREGSWFRRFLQDRPAP